MVDNQTFQSSLSICIPAYNRPVWLKRAISSILTTSLAQQSQIEIIISDDSTISGCKEVVEQLMKNWQGDWQYKSNSPSLGMAGNWNQCIRMASMNYILILHDDDYLESKALDEIIQTLSLNPDTAAFLFGVNIVTSQEKKRKRQIVKKKTSLSTKEALEKILGDSSFIRFPGIVIKTEAFEKVGNFDESIGGIADIHMWIRICHEYGLLCIPTQTANYTIHDNALTMTMFNSQVLRDLEEMFEAVNIKQWLPSEDLETAKANYVHPVILAGTVRYLKRLNLKEARLFFTLFNGLNVQHTKAKLKWKIIKHILSLVLGLGSVSPSRKITVEG